MFLKLSTISLLLAATITCQELFHQNQQQFDNYYPVNHQQLNRHQQQQPQSDYYNLVDEQHESYSYKTSEPEQQKVIFNKYPIDLIKQQDQLTTRKRSENLIPTVTRQQRSVGQLVQQRRHNQQKIITDLFNDDVTNYQQNYEKQFVDLLVEEEHLRRSGRFLNQQPRTTRQQRSIDQLRQQRRHDQQKLKNHLINDGTNYQQRLGKTQRSEIQQEQYEQKYIDLLVQEEQLRRFQRSLDEQKEQLVQEQQLIRFGRSLEEEAATQIEDIPRITRHQRSINQMGQQRRHDQQKFVNNLLNDDVKNYQQRLRRTQRFDDQQEQYEQPYAGLLIQEEQLRRSERSSDEQKEQQLQKQQLRRFEGSLKQQDDSQIEDIPRITIQQRSIDQMGQQRRHNQQMFVNHLLNDDVTNYQQRLRRTQRFDDQEEQYEEPYAGLLIQEEQLRRSERSLSEQEELQLQEQQLRKVGQYLEQQEGTQVEDNKIPKITRQQRSTDQLRQQRRHDQQKFVNHLLNDDVKNYQQRLRRIQRFDDQQEQYEQPYVGLLIQEDQLRRSQ